MYNIKTKSGIHYTLLFFFFFFYFSLTILFNFWPWYLNLRHHQKNRCYAQNHSPLLSCLVKFFFSFLFPCMLSFAFVSFSHICEIILKDLADSHGYDIAAMFGIIYDAALLHLHYFYYKEMDASVIKKCLPFIVCYYCFPLRMWVVSFILIHSVYCK